MISINELVLQVLAEWRIASQSEAVHHRAHGEDLLCELCGENFLSALLVTYNFGQGFSPVLPDDVRHSDEVEAKQYQGG